MLYYRLHWSQSVRVAPAIELSDRYSASKLMTVLAQPGHHLPLAVTFGFFTLSRSKRLLYGDGVGT